jgi:hypothetical protein
MSMCERSGNYHALDVEPLCGWRDFAIGSEDLTGTPKFPELIETLEFLHSQDIIHGAIGPNLIYR